MATVFDLPEDHSLRVAHKKCGGHRTDIERSALCGCFYCKEIFTPDRIVEWVDNDTTALCRKVRNRQRHWGRVWPADYKEFSRSYACRMVWQYRISVTAIFVMMLDSAGYGCA